MDTFECGKEPQTILPDRAAQRGYVILPRKGLLGIRSRILDGKSRIQRGRALVKCRVAMERVRSSPGCDHNRSGRGTARVRVLLRGPDREFMNSIGRVILQEASDIVIGVVSSIHGKFVVQSRASSR